MCVCLMMCSACRDLINSLTSFFFFFPPPSCCAAGHDVRREAMGASSLDMRRYEKNAMIQSGRTKPIQPSIVLPPTGTLSWSCMYSGQVVDITDVYTRNVKK